MPYIIEYSPEAEEHLQRLTARQRKIVLDTVDRQIAQPAERRDEEQKTHAPEPGRSVGASHWKPARVL